MPMTQHRFWPRPLAAAVGTLALLALSSGAAPAQAQAGAPAPASCRHAPDIVAVARFLLEEPADPPRFWRDRFGDDAAFLIIHYAGLNRAQAHAILTRLEGHKTPPQRLKELQIAFATPAERRAALSAATVRPNGSALEIAGVSGQRALMLEEDPGWILAEFGRWFAADRARAGREMLVLASALGDLDDAAKARLAAKAEAASVRPLALALLERRSDLADWLALVDRDPAGKPAPEQRDVLIRSALGLWGRGRPLDLSRQPADVRRVAATRTAAALGEASEHLMRLAPEAQMLLTVLNQTGELRLLDGVMRPLIGEIESGRLTPAETPDALLVALGERLDGVLGRPLRESQLAAFTLGDAWPSGQKAQVAIDMAAARLALAPYLRGETATLPARPEIMSTGFAWTEWTETAAALKAGTAPAAERRLIAADLLRSIGRAGDAIALLRAETDVTRARQLAHDTLRKLDGRCAWLLSHPAPLAIPLYRFER